MSRRKNWEMDISVSSAKRKQARKRGMSGEVGATTRTCEWQGCDKPAPYRAPRSRDRLNEFRWFCLEHVREYNSRWNYYENMSDEEVQESLESDQLWGRPTWKFGEQPPNATGRVNPHADGEAWRRFGFDDPMDVLGEKATLNPGAQDRKGELRERLLPKTVRRALEIMDLSTMCSKRDIRLRYKELVKRYHPDQNGGDRSDEARLRDVLWAWDQLKGSDAFPEK